MGHIENIKKLIAEKGFKDQNRILNIVQVGSHTRGLNDENSDFDFRVLLAPTKSDLLGVEVFEHAKFNTAQDGITTSSDYDIEIFSVKKFMQGLQNGITTCAEMLFMPNQYQFLKSDMLEILNEGREIFLTKKLVKNYFSYAYGVSNKALFGNINAIKRQERKDSHLRMGYDTRGAMKAVLHYEMGLNVLNGPNWTPDVSDEVKVVLRDIVNEKYKKDDIEVLLTEYNLKTKNILTENILDDSYVPDVTPIFLTNKVAIKIHQEIMNLPTFK